MKNILSITVIAFILGLFRCTSTSTDSESQVGTTENIYDIEIENNQKWVVVEDMMAHIQGMDADIESTGNAETIDFDGLGERLNENIELLTSNCTMTGKAHDELHKWLIPFIDLVGDLNEASTYDEKQSIFKSLEKSMEEFNAYFE